MRSDRDLTEPTRTEEPPAVVLEKRLLHRMQLLAVSQAVGGYDRG